DVGVVSAGGWGNAGIVERPGKAALIGGGAGEVLALVNGRAAAEQRMRRRLAAVQLQRAEHRVGVGLVRGLIQETAAAVAAEVVAERSGCAADDDNVVAVQDGAADLHDRAEGAGD